MPTCASWGINDQVTWRKSWTTSRNLPTDCAVMRKTFGLQKANHRGQAALPSILMRPPQNSKIWIPIYIIPMQAGLHEAYASALCASMGVSMGTRLQGKTRTRIDLVLSIMSATNAQAEVSRAHKSKLTGRDSP